MLSIEETREALTGPIASIKTPFNKDGSIDYNGLRNYTDFIIEEGETKTVLLTNGDSLYTVLTDQEVANVTKTVVEQTAGRAIVVSAERGWWTNKAKKFARYAKKIGVDIHMVLPPDWAKSSNSNTLYNHFKEISKTIPVMIVTALENRPVPLETVKKILKNKNNIVAIKDDTAGSYGRRLATIVDRKIPLLSGGRKENHLDNHFYGVDGYLSVYMSFKPMIAHKYWDRISKEHFNEAADIIKEYDIPLLNLSRDLGIDFDALIHGAMEIFNITSRWRRPPYYNMSKQEIIKLKKFLKERELL